MSTKLKNKDFFDTFLEDVLVESTEIVPRSLFWRWLRDDYLIGNSGKRLKIWLPESISGDELYTLCIVLKEIDMLDNVDIFATSICQGNINKAITGYFDTKKVEPSTENYKRFQGTKRFSDYYSENGAKPQRDNSLIKYVTLNTINLLEDKLPVNMDLILFRNHFIYYNPSLQTKTLELLYNSLSIRGLMAIGIQETVGSSDKIKLHLLNEAENVYQKR
ncbi:MAG: hypothetical protein HC896_15535 [Bacteroidales bacterium]|nr:hypothetical protein [Bacteroidales bacterium]